MTGISYLSPSQAKTTLTGIKLQTVYSKKAENFTYEGSLPAWVEQNPPTSFLRVEGMALKKSNGEKASFFSASYRVCGEKTCKKEKSEAREESNAMSNWLRLPTGIAVSSIAYGDVNKDDISDVVIKLSNGAAYLFLSKQSSAW